MGLNLETTESQQEPGSSNVIDATLSKVGFV
jgi:hypothetical protein